MRILDRYVLAEMALPFVTGILAVIMMLVGNTLYALVDLILRNHIPLVVILRLIVFNLPTLLVLTMPVGVAVSAAMAINRFAHDSELTVVRMAGVSLRRIFLPIFLVGFAASCISFVIDEHVVPWSQKEFQKTQAAMFGYAVAASPSLVANRVFVYENYAFYVGAASQDPKAPHSFNLRKVLIIENPVSTSSFPRFFTANTANYHNGVWTLYDVGVHSMDNAGFTSVEMRAAQMKLDLRTPLPVINDNANGFGEQPDSLTMKELAAKIRDMSKTGLEDRSYEVAYFFKLSLPFLCLSFGLCAPPLAMMYSRSGSFVGILLAIVMVWLAWNTVILVKALGIHGYIPPVLSAWATDIIFGAIGLYLIWRME
ncbi:MAG: LptF/LptG family permease [Capsulimonadaceae bacterium]|nr:LptF/LptG family permease [Capsulimonadaceae bacterium]